MRRVVEMSATFWLLCFLQVVTASERLGGPKDLAIVGPNAAKLNESIRLKVEGFPDVDLEKTMKDQLNWITSVRILVDRPNGVDESKYTLDQDLRIKLSPFRWSFSLDFAARVAGDYVLVIDWNEAPYGLVTHRVQVGGGGPPPKPDPPPVPGKRTITILRESATATPDLANLQLAMQAHESLKQHRVTWLDPDSKDQDGNASTRVAAIKAALGSSSLPGVVIEDERGVVLFAGTLPGTLDEVLSLIKKYGG